MHSNGSQLGEGGVPLGLRVRELQGKLLRERVGKHHHVLGDSFE